MCRIVGILCFNKNKLDVNNFIEMRDTMRPGGPDAEGIFIDDEASLALGHRRLSILDITDAGNQPMHSRSGRYVISYNGEVYNFAEIRADLEKLGHSFHTKCDTEVILAAFQEYGIDCVKDFHGMFAIAIWDKVTKRLTLIRDRIGVKPIYYYFTNEYFIFASELKAIVKFKHFQKLISKDGLYKYFKFGYIPSPSTIFDKCMKLEAGHFLVVSSNGEQQYGKWWRPSTEKYSAFDWNDEQAVITETKECLRESFQRRLVSDVEVGLFLSGGVDSGLLAAMLTRDYGNQLSTFTVGFVDERFDESSAANYLANKLGTQHHYTQLDVDEGKDLIGKIYKVWDEPFADTSTISTYLVCQFASKYVKVALSADGGDELFGGYPKHWLTIDRTNTLRKIMWLKSVINLLPDRYLEAFSGIGLGNKLLKTKEILKVSDPKNLMLNTFIIGQHIYSDYQLSKLFGLDLLQRIEFSGVEDDQCLLELDEVNQLLFTDLITYHVDDIHFKVDRASMAHSLEAREPYLDQDLLNLSYSMPSSLKIKNGDHQKGKYILRKIFGQYVDQEYLKLPKKGFGVPLDRWLLQDLDYLIEAYLGESFLRTQGLFRIQQVRKIVSQFKRFPQKELNKIWSLISFQLWYEEWMS